MRAYMCASRLVGLLPGLLWKYTCNSRASVGEGKRGSWLLLSQKFSNFCSLLPNATPSLEIFGPDTDTHTFNYTYLIPTLSATIKCSGNIVDGLVEALMSFGASSVSVENAASIESTEDSINGPAAWSNDKQNFWNQCELVALFPPGQNVEECLAFAFDSAELKETLPYKLTEVKHQNWEQQVKDLFQPLKVSNSLWIIPHWSSPPEPSATNVILDPGLAFGTGDHPTTQLCLRWLSDVVKGGECILDYGTGSGILAITGLKLGAARVVGVDIDPVAVSSAKHNAALNGFGWESLQVFMAPSSGDEQIPGVDEEYDMVVANLLLNPLLLLSGRLLDYTKPGGLLALSGILESQVDQVRETYGFHLEKIEVQIQDGWACLSGTKIQD